MINRLMKIIAIKCSSINTQYHDITEYIHHSTVTAQSCQMAHLHK